MNDIYKIGEYLVDSFYIYQITGLKDGTDFTGKQQVMVSYKPIGDSEKNFIASIPLSNMSKSGFRRLMSTNEAKSLLKNLENYQPVNEYNNVLAKEDIYQNNLGKVVGVLMRLWMQKLTLTKADSVFSEAIFSNICREISLVLSRDVSDVRKKFSSILDKELLGSAAATTEV